MAWYVGRTTIQQQAHFIRCEKNSILYAGYSTLERGLNSIRRRARKERVAFLAAYTHQSQLYNIKRLVQ